MAKTKGRPEPLPCKDDLLGSLEHAWKMLHDGAIDRRAPFHVATLATVDQRGHPQARSVVLRDCNVVQRWVRFNTDMRTEKAKNIEVDRKAAILFYDAPAKVQIRLQVRLEILKGDALGHIWRDTPHYSRECYQVTSAPGVAIESPHDVLFDADAADEGAEHFAPVRAHIEELEWLYLAVRGHRRARFRFHQDDIESQWLVP